MNSPGHALLVVGSPKRPRSTSESLGEYLLDRLKGRGFETDTLFVHRWQRKLDGEDPSLAACDRTGLIILASPLYVDSLPAALVRFMETVAEHRQGKEGGKAQRLVAIVNSGFPEARQSETALAICRRFAKEVGLEFAGGLALGGGEAINGRPLTDLGRMVRNVRRSLDLVATALANGEPVPQEAVSLMAKPMMPSWGYTFLGNLFWKRRARKYGVTKRLRDRPYQK